VCFHAGVVWLLPGPAQAALRWRGTFVQPPGRPDHGGAGFHGVNGPTLFLWRIGKSDVFNMLYKILSLLLCKGEVSM
jgi:hypothetical protein